MSSSRGVLSSSCGVGLLSDYDLSERSSLVVGAFSLVVEAFSLVVEGCPFLVVTGALS